MHPVLAALPRRVHHLHPPGSGWRAPLFSLLSLLFFGAIFGWLAYDVGPTLLEDRQVRTTALPLTGTRLEGRCSSRMGLFQSCDITLIARTKNGELRREVTYMFVEPHLGSRSAQVMGDPARPELLTSDLGIDFFWNRVATFAAIEALVLALTVGGVVAALRTGGRRRAAKALSGQVLEPAAVQFVGWQDKTAWIVEDEAARRHVWPVPPKSLPFVLDDDRGLVLALRTGPGAAPFPLDDALSWAELTEAERTALRTARDATLPPASAPGVSPA